MLTVWYLSTEVRGGEEEEDWTVFSVMLILGQSLSLHIRVYKRLLQIKKILEEIYIYITSDIKT